MSANTNAYQVDIQTVDINGGSPIQGVLLTVLGNETQPINTTTTDADGLASIWINETLTHYQYTYTKLGYHTLTKNYTAETIIYEALYPISEDGITRIVFHDKTNDEREYCIYYKQNMRLDDCYLLNDTVSLLVNQEYIILPKSTFTDALSSPQNIRNNIGVFSGLITGIILLFIFLYMIWNFKNKIIK